MTNEQILSFVDETLLEHPNWRKGQALFNILPTSIQNVIRATEFDPFYNDEIIPKTLNFIQENFEFSDSE